MRPPSPSSSWRGVRYQDGLRTSAVRSKQSRSFIRHGQLVDTFAIADILLHHPHDLIQKAVGWLLREAGKRDKAALEAFLQPHYTTMPRTMLRYAIEKFPEPERKRYLAR